MSDTPNARTPEEIEGVELNQPAEYAGGPPAVFHALKHVKSQSGLMRGGKALLRLNQKGGFDCPSCAWPDPDGHRSAFEFCENGAKAVASEATKRVIGGDFFARHTVAELAGKSDYWLDQQGRLGEPMVLREGAVNYEPISWDEAFSLVAGELDRLPDANGAIFYTSGRASNEAAFLYQLFARSFGTNNLPDCSNMCHESSGMALNQTIGVGKGTVTLDDLREAELILIVGQNPGTNHPRMLTTLQHAKEHGAHIVSINPLREAGLVAFAHPQRLSQSLGDRTPLADTFIRVPTNGDQALFQALAKRLFELEEGYGNVLDREFLGEYCSGFEAYREHVERVNWETLKSESGLDYGTIDELANRLSNAKRIVSCWAMGLTQHRNAVATIQDLTSLHLLLGAIGKRGAGLCPVRGHSNVQGDRTMGICEHMPESFLAQLDSVFQIASPRGIGLNTVQAIRDMKANPGRVFFALGGNFLSATPDTEYTAEALRNCRLTVQVSTKLNRSHLVTGRTALILPCLGRTELDEQESGEQWVSVENSMGIVHSSTGQLKPVSSQLKSEVAIVCNVAKRCERVTGRIDWNGYEKDYRKIRDAIEKVVPGFANYNLRARRPGGYYLPNAARDRRFETDTGKAKFAINHLDVEKASGKRLLLMTIRSHDQFNTTIYGLDDRYRGIKGERRVIFMNAMDMRRRGIVAEELVDVHSFFAGEERVSRLYQAIPYDLPRRCAAMYFPEANTLVPIGHTAHGSDTPASKSVQIEVRKRDEI